MGTPDESQSVQLAPDGIISLQDLNGWQNDKDNYLLGQDGKHGSSLASNIQVKSLSRFVKTGGVHDKEIKDDSSYSSRKVRLMIDQKSQGNMVNTSAANIDF